MKIQKFICLSLITFGCYSCSKDSDLLSEYIISNEDMFLGQNILVNDRFFVKSNEKVNLDVLANDLFSDSVNNVQIVGISNPEFGILEINNQNNTLIYEINNDSLVDGLNDSFDYTVEAEDENGNIEEATANVIIETNGNPFKNLGELKAFPGAEGFGKYTTGGREGKVIEVTNLNDSGLGSLRFALEQNEPRTVIFKVEGNITLNSSLEITTGNITIAGQTAPGKGITLRRNNQMKSPILYLRDGNVILRGLRLRAGKGVNGETGGDNLTIMGGDNFMIDHCSFSWSTDELVDLAGPSNITLQNCLFSEALMYSSHDYTNNTGSSAYYNGHSMAMIIGAGTSKVTIYNSTFAHNNSRNILVGGDSNPGNDFEFVNNVFYNWGRFGTLLNPPVSINVNLINNIYVPGVDSGETRYSILIGESTNLYALGNINAYRFDNKQDEWDAIGNALLSTKNMAIINKSSNPFDFPLRNTPKIDMNVVLESIVYNSGAFYKDDIDLRIANDIFNGTGKIINDPDEVGGYIIFSNIEQGYIDKDKDGISDSWETSHGLNPEYYEDGNLDSNEDGFTNLEEFLNDMILESF